jgi:hypothetical protein
VEEEAMMPPPEYVLARRVLLDALAGLAGQRDAIVLVGAQAGYLNVGDADLAVAPMTTDGDLAIDPRRLVDLPVIGEALASAGFVPGAQPGSWRGYGDVVVDLMVPSGLALHPGRRSVDLGVHGRLAARLTPGLEAAVVDHHIQKIRALDPADAREFDVRVAGVAALLVAKLHKLGERLGTRRMEDKDALDVLRLLRGSDADTLAERLRGLEVDSVAGPSTRAAIVHLETVFVERGAVGPIMAARAAAHVEPEEEIRASTEVLAAQLFAALRRRA